jgi:hypothetical protein
VERLGAELDHAVGADQIQMRASVLRRVKVVTIVHPLPDDSAVAFANITLHVPCSAFPTASRLATPRCVEDPFAVSYFRRKNPGAAMRKVNARPKTPGIQSLWIRAD